MLASCRRRRRPRISFFLSLFRSGLSGASMITDRDGGMKRSCWKDGAACVSTGLSVLSPFAVVSPYLLSSLLSAVDRPRRQLKDRRIDDDMDFRGSEDDESVISMSPSFASKFDEAGREMVFPRSIEIRLADLRNFLTSLRAPLSWPPSSEAVTMDPLPSPLMIS